MIEDKPKSKWLIFSHAFNMDGRAASLTVTDKIPRLIERGVEPIVLSAKTGEQDANLEHYQLLPFAPSGLRFDMRHILKKKYPKKGLKYQLHRGVWNIGLFPFYALERVLLHLESHWSWYWPAYRKGLQLCRDNKIDVIYSSAGANSAHVAARKLSKKTGIPWIAEIHDPMVHDEWSGSKTQFWWNKKQETVVCEHASLAWWFTDNVLAQARARNPVLGDRGIVVLPGVGKPDFGKVAYEKGETFVISHFGSLATTRNLSDPIKAIKALIMRRPELAGKVELHVYGTGLDSVSQSTLEARDASDCVVVHGRLERDPKTSKSGRQRVLEAMRTSDVLLLVHGHTPFCEQYIPSKFYEYLWARRPILGMPHKNPQLWSLLEEQGNEPVASGDLEGLELALEKLVDQWLDLGLPDLNTRPYTVDGAVDRILAHCDSLGFWKGSHAC